MSVEMHTYVPAVTESLGRKWVMEMGKLGMPCEMHPEIALASHSGFLPFKVRINDSAHEELNGVDYLTGFEYYVTDFNLDMALEEQAPRPTWIGRLFRKNPPAQPYSTPALDEKLRQCRKLLTFSWGSADLFELRMATVSSVVVAELTGGVSSYPADSIWYDRPATVALSEAQAYENALKSKDLRVHKFERWL